MPIAQFPGEKSSYIVIKKIHVNLEMVCFYVKQHNGFRARDNKTIFIIIKKTFDIQNFGH